MEPTPASQFGKLGQFARRRPGIVILIVLLVLLCTVVFYGAAAILFGKWAVDFLPGSDWTLRQFPDPICLESEGCLDRLTSAYTDLFYFLEDETVIYDRGDHFTIRSFAGNKFAPYELDRVEHSGYVNGSVISPDKSHLAVCFHEADSNTSTIQIWNISSRQLLFQDVLSCVSIERMSFSWDNRLLAVSYGMAAQNPSFIEIWNLQGQNKQVITGDYGAFSPDNQFIVVLTDNRTMSLLSLEDFQVKRTFAIRYPDREQRGAMHPTFSPDGQWLAVNLTSYNKNDVILLRHLPDGELRYQLTLSGALRCQPVFSPDSLRLATCTHVDSTLSTATPQGTEEADPYSSIVSIWQLEDGTLLQQNQFSSFIGGGFSLGKMLDFSPDGVKMGFGVGSSGYVVIDTYYGLKQP